MPTKLASLFDELPQLHLMQLLPAPVGSSQLFVYSVLYETEPNKVQNNCHHESIIASGDLKHSLQVSTVARQVAELPKSCLGILLYCAGELLSEYRQPSLSLIR